MPVPCIGYSRVVRRYELLEMEEAGAKDVVYPEEAEVPGLIASRVCFTMMMNDVTTVGRGLTEFQIPEPQFFQDKIEESGEKLELAARKLNMDVADLERCAKTG
jgi:hypothetical protein